MSDPIRGVKRRLSQGLVEVGRRAAYRPETFCFVSGSYRSGTTAVADWLARQDDAAGFSESRLTMAAHAMLQQVQRFKKLAADGDEITGELRRMLLGYYLKQSGGRRPRLLIDKEPLGPIGLPDRNYGEFLANVRRLFPGVKLDDDEPRPGGDAVVDDAAGLRAQPRGRADPLVHARRAHRQLVCDGAGDC